MKYLVFILFILFSAYASAQIKSTYPIRADTVRIYVNKTTGAELKLENSTKDTTGVLVNIGGGRTRFLKSRALNDSTIIVGLDTLVLRGATGSLDVDSLYGDFGITITNPSGRQFHWEVDSTEIATQYDISQKWSLTGNANTIDGTHFLGTTNSVPLSFRVNNVRSGRIDAGNENTYFGYSAGLADAGDAFTNTGIGHFALSSITEGESNVALGANALQSLTTGSNNMAVGRALINLTTGLNNTVIGFGSGGGITTGSNNTIIGSNVSGLSSSLSNNIILSDGTGNIRQQFDASGNLNIDLQTLVSLDTTTWKLAVQDASGNIRRSHWQAAGGGSSSLTDTYIGFGDASNVLTGSADLIWNNTTKQLTANGTGLFDRVAIGAVDNTYALNIDVSGTLNDFGILLKHNSNTTSPLTIRTVNLWNTNTTANSYTGLANVSPAGNTNAAVEFVNVNSTTSGGIRFSSRNGSGQGSGLWLSPDRTISIGNEFQSPTATLHVQGSTADNTASVFKLENSSATLMLNVKNDGSVTLPLYGSGTFTGTATKWLAVTSGGLLIEQNAPSVGTLQTVTDAGAVTTNNVTFSGTGTAITASSGTVGAILTGSSSGGVFTGGSFGIEANSATIPFLASNTSATAGVVTGVLYQRNGSYTGAANDGIGTRYSLKNSAGTSKDAVLIDAMLTTATAAAETGAVQIKLMSGGSSAALSYNFTPSLLTLNTGQLNIATQFTPANSTDATYGNKTITIDDSFIYYRTSTGTWKKIAWAVF